MRWLPPFRPSLVSGWTSRRSEESGPSAGPRSARRTCSRSDATDFEHVSRTRFGREMLRNDQHYSLPTSIEIASHRWQLRHFPRSGACAVLPSHGRSQGFKSPHLHKLFRGSERARVPIVVPNRMKRPGRVRGSAGAKRLSLLAEFLPLGGVRFRRCPGRPLRLLPCRAVLRPSDRSRSRRASLLVYRAVLH
jgi:hypothetical protein